MLKKILSKIKTVASTFAMAVGVIVVGGLYVAYNPKQDKIIYRLTELVCAHLNKDL